MLLRLFQSLRVIFLIGLRLPDLEALAHAHESGFILDARKIAQRFRQDHAAVCIKGELRAFADQYGSKGLAPPGERIKPVGNLIDNVGKGRAAASNEGTGMERRKADYTIEPLSHGDGTKLRRNGHTSFRVDLVRETPPE